MLLVVYSLTVSWLFPFAFYNVPELGFKNTNEKTRYMWSGPKWWVLVVVAGSEVMLGVHFDRKKGENVCITFKGIYFWSLRKKVRAR